MYYYGGYSGYGCGNPCCGGTMAEDMAMVLDMVQL